MFLVELSRSEALRAAIAAVKPDWIDAIVFEEVPDRSQPVIDAELRAPETIPFTLFGFAAAGVAQSHGAFDHKARSVIVRFSQATVAVTIDFDVDAESFFGEATIEPC